MILLRIRMEIKINYTQFMSSYRYKICIGEWYTYIRKTFIFIDKKSTNITIFHCTCKVLLSEIFQIKSYYERMTKMLCFANIS